MVGRRIVLSDSLSPREWQQLRTRQAQGGAGVLDVGLPAPGLRDGMPMAEWQAERDRQARGETPGPRDATSMRLAAAQPVAGARGPLTGRPGKAAIVAGALNAIASGPNTSAPVNGLGVPSRDVRVSRGSGRDIRTSGRVLGTDVSATGTLDPPTGRAEISASGVRGEHIGLPSRLRVYNTPGGELDLELPGPVRLGPVGLPAGTYVIGTPDPPRAKSTRR